MSSPYVCPRGDYPDRCVASSPPPVMLATPEPQEPSIRPMRLKVLYTFDNENKTNCLARWPQILNIRTAQLDETTQVGVIELKTCIQAIVAASPEITAKLGLDYTVYAYDYSEYETPLVGQGMLSWVLASASTTPSAPAHQSSTYVTGRVCKNILGLFGNGIQETLEVKLRLVPVPSCLQSEYIESMKQYRDVSRFMPEGFDAQAWTEFLKANPGILSTIGQSRSQSPAASSELPQHGLERVQHLMSAGYGLANPTASSSRSRRGSYATTILSGHEDCRPASPTPSTQSMATSQPAQPPYGHYGRAASRTSDRVALTRPRRSSVGSTIDQDYGSIDGVYSNDERAAEDPPRKRAKVIKADPPRRGTTLGKKVDSLRVTASAAASMRVFQPTAIRPPVSGNPPTEEPPRVPTPIPQSFGPRRRPLLSASRSSLGESMLTSDSGYKTMFSESESISPEKAHPSQSTNSPEELGSSPPIARDLSAAPSSPVLPPMPQHEELDFLHESNEIALNDGGDTYLPWSLNDSHEDAFDYTQQALTSVQLKTQLTEEDLRDSRNRDNEEAKRKELSMRNARKALGLKRSQTWAGDQPSSDPQQPPRRASLARSESMAAKPSLGWNKEKRKKAIQSKLNSSIQAGEMPPFCENCGAIETPTWRKAYSRLHSGDHSQVQLGTGDGAIVAIQIMETNEDGSTKIFKIYKKTRTAAEEEEGFTDVLLCNPCGIWLSSRKGMRPSRYWSSKDGKGRNEVSKEKPRKSRAKKKAGADGERSDLLDLPSEAANLASELSIVPFLFDGIADQSCNLSSDRMAIKPDGTRQAELPLVRAKTEPQPLLSRVNVAKDDTTPNPTLDVSAIVALQRAIQSSPGQNRFLGSQQSPIEIDKHSPDPARRSLFSSPKTKGPLGVSAGRTLNGVQKPGKTPKAPQREGRGYDSLADKENLPPRSSTPDDGLEDLFSGFSPRTPLRGTADSSKSPCSLFKTPIISRTTPSHPALTTGDFFSSAAKVFLHGSRTPSRTPTKRSAHSGTDATPFSMHLDRLLSDKPNTPSDHLMSEMNSLPPLAATDGDDEHPDIADGGTPSRMFRTVDFDFTAFASSDMPIPSSPPAWFGVYEDPIPAETEWDVRSEAGNEDGVTEQHGGHERGPADASLETAPGVHDDESVETATMPVAA